MSTEVLIGIAGLAISAVTVLSAWIMYAQKARNRHVSIQISNLANAMDKSDQKSEADMRNLHSRVSSLEINSVSKNDVKDFIDDRISPMQETLNEIKQDSKETRETVTLLVMNFSHLLGKMGIDNLEIKSPFDKK